MAIVWILVWNLIAKNALAFISIEVEPSLMDFGQSDVNISCVVNNTNLIGIIIIQLMRSEKNVVSVTKFKIAWQDEALENKTGVTAYASINNTMTSYLHLEISKAAVRYPGHMGSYQCLLIAVNASGEIERYLSQSIVLNITEGFLETSTNIFSTTNHKSTEVSVQKGHQEISTESFTNTDKPPQKKHLILYRNIMIPVTTFISGMFAFIIARELWLYYFVSKAKTTAKNTKYTNGVYIV